MNPIINLLIKENNYSIERVKQIYHILAKKVHPDVSNKNYDFVLLKKYYEEALTYVHNKKKDSNFNDENNIEEDYIDAISRTLLTNIWEKQSDIPENIIFQIQKYDSKLIQLLYNYKNLMNSFDDFSKPILKLRWDFIQIFYRYFDMIDGEISNKPKFFLIHEKDFISKRFKNDDCNKLLEAIVLIIKRLKEDLIKRRIVAE